MEGGSSANPPSDGGNPAAGSVGGASKFLANLPSRGLFSSSILSTNPGGMRVYMCDHDTSPPVDQIIRTNQTNILIRSLMLKNQNGGVTSKDGKGNGANQGSRKRASEKPLDKAAGKKAMTSSQHGSSQEGSSHVSDRDLHNLTVDRLRALLKERGLSVRGRKDELIARLRG